MSNKLLSSKSLTENNAAKSTLYTHTKPELKKKVQHLEQKGQCLIGPILHSLCRLRAMHQIIFRMLCILEGDTMFSMTLREVLNQYYDVEVGMYSYGPCMQPGALPAGTRIGNFCSIADGLRVFRRNHPADRMSQHALFFNHNAGIVMNDTIESIETNPWIVGHDVWIAANVIVAPGCKAIGNGAIVAAGAVLAEDVPAFAIVGGVPAKLIRWRFDEDIQHCIEKSQWWLRPLSELVDLLPLFEQPVSLEIAKKIEEALR